VTNNTTKTAAELAREAAGMTRAELAKKVRLSENYIKKIERHGRASFTLAERLAVLCDCRIETYI